MNRNILHHPNWAFSAGGRNIELYQTANTEEALLFVGGVHGDEPEGVRLASELLNWLQKNNKVNFPNWLLIPNLNPDGSAAESRTNGHGVDLNRNFPSSDWSPETKAPRYFPGPQPGSEPETQALSLLIQAVKPVVIIHFHSWKPCIVYTGEDGATWAKKIAEGTGYEWRPDIGYPTPGSLGQYGWLMHQTPVVCVEAQDNSPLDEIWPKFSYGLIQLFENPIRSVAK